MFNKQNRIRQERTTKFDEKLPFPLILMRLSLLITKILMDSCVVDSFNIVNNMCSFEKKVSVYMLSRNGYFFYKLRSKFPSMLQKSAMFFLSQLYTNMALSFSNFITTGEKPGSKRSSLAAFTM